MVPSYLQVEWEVRRGTPPRRFTSDSMRSSSCRVPQQDNSSDCGVYLLQYAESFLQVTSALTAERPELAPRFCERTVMQPQPVALYRLAYATPTCSKALSVLCWERPFGPGGQMSTLPPADTERTS